MRKDAYCLSADASFGLQVQVRIGGEDETAPVVLLGLHGAPSLAIAEELAAIAYNAVMEAIQPLLTPPAEPDTVGSLMPTVLGDTE